MSANVDAMVREGINAYRAGNKEEARTLLLKAVELDEQNEQAWLWLSAVVDTVEDQQTCLENVLTINPNNERAQQGMRVLKQKAAGSAAVTSSQQADEDAFASVSFTQPTPAPMPAAPTFDEADELPSDSAWDEPPTETSSASSRRRVNEPTSADYDDWVAGLNLNNSPTPAAPPPPVEPASPFSSPFLMDDLDVDAFGFDDDDPAIPQSTSAAFDAGPFAARADVPMSFGDDEDEDELFTPQAMATSANARVMSPPRADDEFVLDLETGGDFPEDFDDIGLGTLDASEFFSHIPAEIQPTRLPGSREREPILALLLFVILLLVNVAAIGLLVMTLIGRPIIS
jgi:hypothetical protein